jgi:type 1 fimbria pilin
MIAASIRTAFALALLGATAVFTTDAAAADLTIRFSGRFIEPTCDMSVHDVDLGEASVSAFTGSFAAPWVNVPIDFANCAALTSVATLGFSGTADANQSDLYAGRTGVGVELRVAPNGTLLGPGSTPVDVPIVNGGAKATFVARMTQTAGGVTPGAFSTPVTVSVTYQ